MMLALFMLAFSPPSVLDMHEAEFRIDQWRLEVKVKVDERVGWFVLDSAGPSCVERKFLASGVHVRQLGPIPFRHSVWSGVEAPAVRVGGAALSNVDFLILKPSVSARIRSGALLPIDGILGYNALRNTSMALDFEHHRCWFWGPKDTAGAAEQIFGALDSLQSIPLHLSDQDGWATLEERFESGTVDAALDLGSTVGSVPAYLRRSLGQHCAESQLSATVQQYDRTRLASFLIPTRVWIGESEIASPVLCSVTDSGTPSIVGWTQLAAFHRVVVNLRDGQLVLPGVPYVLGSAGFLDSVEVLAGAASDGNSSDGEDWVPLKHWLLKMEGRASLPDLLADPMLNKLVAEWSAQLHGLGSKPPKLSPTNHLTIRMRSVAGPPVEFKPSPRGAQAAPNTSREVSAAEISEDDMPPPPAYRSPDTGRWLSLPTAYDGPIYLPSGTEVNLLKQWGQSESSSGGLVLYPPGVKRPDEKTANPPK